ncbi:UDP-N-acetylmuramoylalanine-D-glutamate ligase [Photobacterium aphoticum]|uniref:UDP-N-acetylmuramoylalanine-D-glutamate ligase n=1 Tax=Photobacterium aphoticum TaxID=754436 RepID=A0A090RG15_9GAMM|nr:UDP-N-acetylmuramoylalanine-D-glutamate ligase [Photobacterium aphoticum]
MGGDGKGADFSDLAPILAEMDVRLYCYGRDREAFLPLAAQSVAVETLAEATTLAAQQARAGDMIMLSPACASLDQFANFMARGDAFVALAEALKDRIGEMH